MKSRPRSALVLESRNARFTILLKASAESMSPETTPEERTRRRGRRVALVIYGAFVGLFIVIASGNVIWQLYGASAITKAAIPCSESLRELVSAVDRAREAASSTPEVSETKALARFREALRPEWDRQPLVASSCADEKELRAALDTIERLRYAEEHAVRIESSELAPLRLAVRNLMNGPLGSSTTK